MNAYVVRGNAGQLPLPDSSVDLIVTSPPYFGLRSYTDGGTHYAGQVGDEQTPTEYLDRLIACTGEWLRVLKPSGSLFVNLGDKYAAQAPSGNTGKNHAGWKDRREHYARQSTLVPGGTKSKSLMLLPQRYAIRCVDELGLILRAEIVWSKPNGLPESVTDRVRRSHEQVFHFTQQQRYYSAVDEIREQYSDRVHERQKYAGRDGVLRRDWSRESGRNDGNGERGILGFGHEGANALGKLPGSVWQIPTVPLQVPAHLGVDHFAAYPPELVRRIVLGWSPREVCQRCGEGRRPVSGAPIVDGYAWAQSQQFDRMRDATPVRKTPSTLGYRSIERDRRVTGYVCACTPWHMEPVPTDRDPDNEVLVYDWHLWDPPPTRPGVVLDPFGGTGTTALVASCHGRTGISVDRSHDYSRLSRWRTRDPAERARVLGVGKPPVQVDGQLGMFDGIGV